MTGAHPHLLANWTPRRLGAHPPEGLAVIRRDCARAMLAAAGVPPDIAFSQTITGAALVHIRSATSWIIPSSLSYGVSKSNSAASWATW